MKTPTTSKEKLKQMPKLPKQEKKERFEGVEMFGISEASPEHPERNEDAFFINKKYGIAGVFDGVGGYGGGEVASKMAAEIIEKELKYIPEDANVEMIKKELEFTLIITANEILKKSQDPDEQIKYTKKTKKSLKNMGTTATILKIHEDKTGKRTAIIGNVGDSRAYLLRNKELKQVTKDDSFLQELIDAGEMGEGDDQNVEKEIPKRIAEIFIKKPKGTVGDIRHKISSCLGLRQDIVANLKPNIYEIPIEPDDKLFLCTDGMSDNAKDEQIKDSLNLEVITAKNKKKITLEENLEIIKNKVKNIEADNANPRSKYDDKTAVLIKI